MIIFLYGEDSFRSRQKLNELTVKFNHEIDPTGSSLSLVDGRAANLREINEQVSPSSLLARKRMVVIEEIFQNKGEKIFEELLYLLKKHEASENILIFLDSGVKLEKKYGKEMPVEIKADGETKPLNAKTSKLFKFLAGQKFVQEFRALSNTDAATWAKKETANRGAQITAAAANLLVGLAGNNLWQINNELDKLINYKAGLAPQLVDGEVKVNIEENDVSELVRGNFDENIFALTDAISAKNKSLTVRLLEEQFSTGLADVYLLAMIIRQFKILLQIRQDLDLGKTQKQMLADLKLHPFVLQKGMAQARNFTLAQLKNIFSKLVEIDYLLKTGKSDLATAIDLLIAQI